MINCFRGFNFVFHSLSFIFNFVSCLVVSLFSSRIRCGIPKGVASPFHTNLAEDEGGGGCYTMYINSSACTPLVGLLNNHSAPLINHKYEMSWNINNNLSDICIVWLCRIFDTGRCSHSLGRMINKNYLYKCHSAQIDASLLSISSDDRCNLLPAFLGGLGNGSWGDDPSPPPTPHHPNSTPRRGYQWLSDKDITRHLERTSPCAQLGVNRTERPGDKQLMGAFRDSRL